MMHHHSIWVEDRPANCPTFEQLPPMFTEYKVFDVLLKAFSLNLGLMLGAFLFGPMLERIAETSPLMAAAMWCLLALWSIKTMLEPDPRLQYRGEDEG